MNTASSLEDLHTLPISQMGNYQDYVKGLEAAGRAPLRELEPQAIRAHAFGNPFKIDKVSSMLRKKFILLQVYLSKRSAYWLEM